MAFLFSLFFRAVKGGIELRWYADVIPTHTSDARVAFWAPSSTPAPLSIYSRGLLELPFSCWLVEHFLDAMLSLFTGLTFISTC